MPIGFSIVKISKLVGFVFMFSVIFGAICCTKPLWDYQAIYFMK